MTPCRRRRRPWFVDLRCSQCHHAFSAEGDRETACPRCGAAAGLEAQTRVPVAMKLFAVLLAGVIVASVAGTLYTVVVA